MTKTYLVIKMMLGNLKTDSALKLSSKLSCEQLEGLRIRESRSLQ
jgi:hypothetical protein